MQNIIIHSLENNKVSQAILEDNRERLTKQCEQVLELLRSGERLNVINAVVKYRIGDLRRRIKDLKDAGYSINEKHIGNGRKEWFIEAA